MIQRAAIPRRRDRIPMPLDLEPSDTPSGATDITPSRGFDFRIWLLVLATFAMGTATLVVAGILSPLAADLGVSVAAAGQVVTAFAVTFAVGSPILAALTGHLPRERLILWVLWVFTFANILCAVAPRYDVLLVGRIIAGGCAGLCTPLAYVLATGLASRQRRGAALATVAIGTTSATVFGVPLGTWIGHQFGWHATFWLVAATGAAAAIVLWASRLPAAPDGEATPGLAARFAPMADPRILLALLPSIIWCTAAYLFYTYVALFLGRRFEPTEIAFLLLFFGLGGVTGSQIGGRIADRLGGLRPITLCLAASIVNLALIDTTSRTFWGGAAALFFWGFCGWATWTPQQTRLIGLAPTNAPIVLSLNNATVYVGTAVGAAGGAVFLTLAPLATLPLAAAALYGLALLVLVATPRRLRPI
jgi:DHA1 family inner membrane transport protein